MIKSRKERGTIMGRKILYPYVIIEFALFFVSILANMTDIGINAEIFTLIGVGLNIPFAALMKTRNLRNRVFAISFTIFAFLGELLYFLGQSLIGEISFLVAFGVMFTLLLMVNKENKVIQVVFGAIALVIGIPLIFVYHLFNNVTFIPLALETGVLLSGFALSFYTYRTIEAKYKPNLFFVMAGLGFFIFFKLCAVANPFVDPTAQFKDLILMCIYAFLIPSIIMSTVSFMLFEPRAS